ncbi:glycosyltransferase family 2 protein [Candidatus Woesearchaeota archaeon]|nr:glycosyltransferase family 2 protein [Candidatus Woesearchaeota archaeon]
MSNQGKMRIFAVIPAYNEERHISGVIEKALSHISCERIIVVDDGSRDRTYSLAMKTGVAVLRHIINIGKGAALKTGCDYAISRGADAIIVLDSDAQHEPDEIPSFIRALDGADIVFGYRELNSRMPLVMKVGNWMLGTAIKLLFRISIRDTQCGYRAFTRQAYQDIRWTAHDYSVESEMIALVGKHRLRFRQIPVETIYVDKYKGTTPLDGLAIVMKMVWWKFTR